MKVAVYSGEIPSTTFIERLIDGLYLSNDMDVYLFGRLKAVKPVYEKPVTIVSYRRTVGQVCLGLWYRALFLTKPGLWRKFKKTGHNANMGLKQRLKFWGKVLPVVYTELDVFHIQWAKNLEEWIFLEQLGVKVICSLRGAHINYSPLADAELAQKYRELFRLCSGFHGVSEAIVTEAAQYADIRPKSRVVYSGLDLDDFSFNHKTELLPPLKIISIGRPHWKKGYHYALDACRQLIEHGLDFSYTIVGGKTEELQYLVSDLNLKFHVHFRDKLSIEGVKEAISKHNMLLLPSVEEGIANVVLESMALGTPVISTDCGGMNEVVKDGITGFLVPVRDADAIAEKIRYVAALTKQDIEAICANARQIVEKNHQKSQMVDGMIGLYKSVR